MMNKNGNMVEYRVEIFNRYNSHRDGSFCKVVGKYMDLKTAKAMLWAKCYNDMDDTTALNGRIIRETFSRKGTWKITEHFIGQWTAEGYVSMKCARVM